MRILLLLVLAIFVGCKDDSSEAVPSRSYRMGFSEFPPKPDLQLAIQTIDMWAHRADAAIINKELPWDSLLAGTSPEALVSRNEAGLASYYRGKGLVLWVYLEPANGIDRSGEAPALVRAGRSIKEQAIQTLFRRYAVAIDSIVAPDHIGLALETNLIRGLSPADLYAAIRKAANDAASDLKARGTNAKLSVSVQVDYAWGRFGSGYVGVAQDFADFPFIEELGLSSYPYLAGFQEPESIPENYYSRIISGKTIPVMVTEGGWSSATVDTMVSSDAEQRRYIVRQARLLDAVHAIAVFQLDFTDLDLVSYAVDPGSVLKYFSHLGLVDMNLSPKAALSAWDSVYAVPRTK